MVKADLRPLYSSRNSIHDQAILLAPAVSGAARRFARVLADLAKNRACMILAKAMAAENEPESHDAADLLHVHADRICSDEFARQHRLGDL